MRALRLQARTNLSRPSTLREVEVKDAVRVVAVVSHMTHRVARDSEVAEASSLVAGGVREAVVQEIDSRHSRVLVMTGNVGHVVRRVTCNVIAQRTQVVVVDASRVIMLPRVLRVRTEMSNYLLCSIWQIL